MTADTIEVKSPRSKQSSNQSSPRQSENTTTSKPTKTETETGTTRETLRSTESMNRKVAETSMSATSATESDSEESETSSDEAAQKIRDVVPSRPSMPQAESIRSIAEPMVTSSKLFRPVSNQKLETNFLESKFSGDLRAPPLPPRSSFLPTESTNYETNLPPVSFKSMFRDKSPFIPDRNIPLSQQNIKSQASFTKEVIIEPTTNSDIGGKVNYKYRARMQSRSLLSDKTDELISRAPEFMGRSVGQSPSRFGNYKASYAVSAVANERSAQPKSYLSSRQSMRPNSFAGPMQFNLKKR